ncbi:hypothetical protein, partial [Klebsiella aerogenes]|uniref:hypothetical protein n=1 Tax=Klebsiella aerogenes TaxID=548 RepID=UPI00195438D0
LIWRKSRQTIETVVARRGTVKQTDLQLRVQWVRTERQDCLIAPDGRTWRAANDDDEQCCLAVAL